MLPNSTNNYNYKPNPSIKLVKKHKELSYPTTPVLDELKNRFDKSITLSNEPLGNKNLVYFTLNYNLDYIFLFLYCLRSLAKFKNTSDYDMLIICPKNYSQIILEIIEAYNIDLNCVNLYFHHVPLSDDGVAASMNKLKVYGWADINKYGKVLFLDVDILFNRPVCDLFKLQLKPGILHSTIHAAQDHLHSTPYHSLKEYSLSELNNFKQQGIYAFNAGQFMFINTPRMLAHFYNIDWLSQSWPDNFFFEQSFMNHYFNTNLISDVQVLLSKFKFMSVHMGEHAFNLPGIKMEEATAIHFAGEPCNATAKRKFIRKHCSYLL